MLQMGIFISNFSGDTPCKLFSVFFIMIHSHAWLWTSFVLLISSLTRLNHLCISSGKICHFVIPMLCFWSRYHSGYGFSQWEEALLCNASSHWPSPYPEWFKWITTNSLRTIDITTTRQNTTKLCRASKPERYWVKSPVHNDNKHHKGVRKTHYMPCTAY